MVKNNEHTDQRAGTRIFLPGEEPLDLAKAKDRIGKMKHYVDGFTEDELPEGLVTRRNPFCGEFERVSLRDVCTDAVVRTIMNSLRGYPSDYLYYFLNPAKMGREDTPYREKLPVITKLLEEYYGEFYGGHHATLYAGNIPDPTSPMIYSDPRETEFFWFQQDTCFGAWEVLFNVNKPETHFLFKNVNGPWNSETFQELRKRHEERNLFSEGPISFIKHVGGGYDLPILGVTKISGLFYVGHGMTVQTDLVEGGIEAREVENSQWERHWLRPEGYSERSR